MSLLFSPLRLREVTFRNRVFVSPMCMYSAEDGLPNDWHFVHLGSRAVGGAGLVMVEATGVSPEGRITPHDTGLWNDAQAQAFEPTVAFMKKSGAVAGVQLAHAGRKASTDAPWRGGTPMGPDAGGWQPIAPSPIPFDEHHLVPREMTIQDIDRLVSAFASSAERAMGAGFDLVEVHAAHGYLLHEFLSPLSNQRSDDYGGSFANRTRIVVRIVEAVRKVVPATNPLFVRFSATDWVEGGWDLEQSIALAKILKERGVDLIDCSSGGNVPKAQIPAGPGYQVPLAEGIRQGAGIATGAVGMITKPEQAEEILARGQADAILLARPLLRNPYWPLHAADALGDEVEWPPQYARGRVHSKPAAPPPTPK